MKKASFIAVLPLALFLGFPELSSGANNAVSKTAQPVRLTIPDSVSLSRNPYKAIVRADRSTGYNTLIGLYLGFAIDTLKAGRVEVAERLMMEDVLPMLSRYGDAYNMYHSFMTLGKSYTGQKKYTQAKWFYIQSNSIAKKIGYRSGELFSLIELARVKETINDFDLALGDYKAAAQLASKLKFTTTLASVNKSIRRVAGRVPPVMADAATVSRVKN